VPHLVEVGDLDDQPHPARFAGSASARGSPKGAVCADKTSDSYLTCISSESFYSRAPLC
jgi:hypothetical protein